MVSQKITVINKEGFHMRPANYFIKEMSEFSSKVNLVVNGKDVNGKSIMNIMAACIKYGTEIEVQCDGDDEEAALAKAIELIENKLGDAE
ncbi:MAG: HPr family phosphocarrier protein [Clostridia bacterium]|nr:HPr family phosphocarrier protein [Clostridia bacterium]